MKTVLKVVCVLLCCLFSGSVGAASASLEMSPTSQLRPVLEDLTSVLADDNLKGDAHKAERRARIMDQIQRGFDFREMSRRVLGKTWRKIDTKDQEYFTVLMTQLLENVYVGRLEGYSDQVVEYAGEKIKGKRAQVTTFVSDNNIKIPVHYIMMLNGARWMVYDINIEGVSLVRNYQQQFKAILRKDKFEGLVKVLEEKNRSF